MGWPSSDLYMMRVTMCFHGVWRPAGDWHASGVSKSGYCRRLERSELLMSCTKNEYVVENVTIYTPPQILDFFNCGQLPFNLSLFSVQILSSSSVHCLPCWHSSSWTFPSSVATRHSSLPVTHKLAPITTGVVIHPGKSNSAQRPSQSPKQSQPHRRMFPFPSLRVIFFQNLESYRSCFYT